MKIQKFIAFGMMLSFCLAIAQVDRGWESLIENATYRCDTAPTKLLDNGSEVFSLAAIEQLAQDLAPLLQFNGLRLRQSAQTATQTLAIYRRHFEKERGNQLMSWQEPNVRFLITGQTIQGDSIAFLGMGSKLIPPGTPFLNGNLLGFNQDRLWFEHDERAIEVFELNVASRKPSETDQVSLFANKAPDHKLLIAVAEELGYYCTILGEPREIHGAFTAPTLKLLFLNMLESEGYEVTQKGRAYTIVRPNSDDLVPMEELLRNTRVHERSGKLMVRVNGPDSLNEESFDPAATDPANYAIVGLDGSLVSLVSADSVAAILTTHSLEMLPKKEVGAGELMAQFHEKLLEMCFDKPLLRDRVLELLPDGFKTLMRNEKNPDRLDRQALLLELISNAAE